MSSLTPEQQFICDKYSLSNYLQRLTSFNQCLTDEEIDLVEKATRGQADNMLWNMLRLDRQTASGSSTNCLLPQTVAMSFGVQQEKLVKRNSKLIELIVETVESRLKRRVSDVVLDCGMFLTRLGLNSASPDAYMILEDGTRVPIEIKCPYTYNDISVDEMRNSLNTRLERYRVKYTAFSVNRFGPMRFVVESSNDHYKQMQRQMTVMNAPICVYVVKFHNSFVVSVVERDETTCRAYAEHEVSMFKMFVSRNKHRKQMAHDKNRAATFEDQHHSYDKMAIDTLVNAGMYYHYGLIKCIHCNNEYCTTMDVDDVLSTHDKSNCANVIKKAAASSSSTRVVCHRDYFDHSVRMASLKKRHFDAKLATLGVFYNAIADRLTTFCCGLHVLDESSVEHKDDCYYKKYV
ncbi:Alkaline exonuclease [Trabala vishnou gigantina nucleopolyhedrovirus]|uniref:Alkaline exonuclease n=1 Tax=Trabala vishnou gigantina nucleopolyhedrovirus TaxID=2863583 RepID=UPI0024819D68|nr:Alkaline exonuclease [Trabala vishnou gigantina nucleopolyhedrovirus]QYC92682.1 Alkaline exonuclease [Trabala vishnou gigantina nucleopolyhedrovirus]